MGRSEAAGRGDSVVNTYHLLLGLLQQGEGAHCEALADVGVTVQAARLQADLFFPSDFADVAPSRLPLSSRARAALEQAMREMVRRGDRHLETEHLLLALLRDPESSAVRLLSGLGVPSRQVEQAVDRVAKPQVSV
jgi:ATP-dependent Clp protease ATP-binding subunit ClpC